MSERISFIRRGRMVTAYKDPTTGRFTASPPEVSYTYTWHALSDACPTCAVLNGQTFEEQDLFNNVLVHHQFGSVWDMNKNSSLAHGYEPYNCRCHVTVEVDVDLSKNEDYVELTNMLGLLT